jgi:hypothetical protein
MIPYVLIVILGNLINAVKYQRSWPWQVRRQRHKVTGIQGMHNSRASYMPCSVSLGPVATVITLSQGHKTLEYPLKPYVPRLGRYIKP